MIVSNVVFRKVDDVTSYKVCVTECDLVDVCSIHNVTVLLPLIHNVVIYISYILLFGNIERKYIYHYIIIL